MNDAQRAALLVAWIQSLVATFGSLFFSEVMKYPPCVLCWYQRIAMFPLALLLGFFWYHREARTLLYALPFAGVGLLISVYHNLLYYHLIPDSITPCTQGISCTSRQVEWFGFITIPLLAMSAFTLICLALLRIYVARSKNQKNEERL